jgi:hypothetical protein
MPVRTRHFVPYGAFMTAASCRIPNLPLELLPGLLIFTAELAHPRLGDAKPVCDSLGPMTGSQRVYDPPLPLGPLPKPRSKIHVETRLVSR